MPKPLKVYLDTSVPNGYFDDENLERQRMTKEFWPKLKEYQVFISDMVIDEIKATGEENRKRGALMKGVNWMPYFSQFYQIEVRDNIAEEFTNSKGEVDDMMTGLHEIRVRRVEKEYDLKALEEKVKKVHGLLRLSAK